MQFLKSRRILARWPRPARFDRDLVVIGAGAAGLMSAYVGTTMKAQVALVEKERMGGDCLNTGCVPSKALIRSARLLSDIGRAREFGIVGADARVDFVQAMERVQHVIRDIEPHDSVERYTRLGVDCLKGDARIVSPWCVEVDGVPVTTRGIIIATGASPLVPEIEGIDGIDYLTSENLWELRELPGRLLVLGGGPVGTEQAQCFSRLGSAVTQVEMAPRILGREDEDVADTVTERLRAEGVKLLTGHRAKAFRRGEDARGGRLIAEHAGRDVEIEFDAVLIAVGRSPRVQGIGLETLGIPLTGRGTIAVNRFMQTRIPTIYACGDVSSPYQFTHTAAHEARQAAANALRGGFWRTAVDYSVIPWCTFTAPEVARVGLSEQQARERGIDHEVTRFRLRHLDRAITEGEAHGFVKVLTEPGKDRIIGATIVGEHAGDVIAEYVLAMNHGIGLRRILDTVHVYPTLAEAGMYAAAKWEARRAKTRMLGWAERFYAWRRGEAGFPILP